MRLLYSNPVFIYMLLYHSMGSSSMSTRVIFICLILLTGLNSSLARRYPSPQPMKNNLSIPAGKLANFFFSPSELAYYHRRSLQEGSLDRISPGGPNPEHHTSPPARD
ncbi:hypothetical protein QQ045_013337 [Rhodiola kirilowii]